MENHAQEEILLEAGALRVRLIPGLGGKIASVAFFGRELLQVPLVPYAPRTRTMPFDAGDASGWDECLPTVAPCSVICGVKTAAAPVSIPDHGDLWRIPWKPTSVSCDTATLCGECLSLPLLLKRTIAVSITAKIHMLSLDYQLTNTGKSSVPWGWSAHPLFAVAAGDRVLLPATIRKLRLEGSTGGRLGATASVVSWPVAVLPGGDTTDLSVVQPPGSGIGDKLFAGPLAPGENWCALERASAGVRIRIEFDPAATPYLGLWICYGGWPARPGPKQNCVALEPSTAPVDSLAQSGPWSRSLAPSESYSWRMTVGLDSLV
jgi:galactose mutarotase-like enzyme